MTKPALRTPFLALVTAAAWLSTLPALAGATAAATEIAPPAHQGVAAPESPTAAFERLLAVRAPTRSAAVARDDVDPLQAPFRAALWGESATAPVRTSAAGPRAEGRK